MEDNLWENKKNGIAGPPIETEYGWILLYHAVSKADKKGLGIGTYSLGIAVLDKKDPSKVIYRQDKPILEPELDWEVDGWVPNVVFSNGQAIVGEDLFVYYGGADTVTGVAKINMKELKKKILEKLK